MSEFLILALLTLKNSTSDNGKNTKASENNLNSENLTQDKSKYSLEDANNAVLTFLSHLRENNSNSKNCSLA